MLTNIIQATRAHEEPSKKQGENATSLFYKILQEEGSQPWALNQTMATVLSKRQKKNKNRRRNKKAAAANENSMGNTGGMSIKMVMGGSEDPDQDSLDFL